MALLVDSIEGLWCGFQGSKQPSEEVNAGHVDTEKHLRVSISEPEY